MHLQATFRGILKLAMKKITWRHIGIFILFVIIAFSIDRLAKGYLLMNLGARWEIVPGVFALTIQENPGIAFSIKLPYIAQIIFTPILLIVGMKLAIDNLKINKNSVLIVLGLIVGGALSNYVDRIFYEGVIDYLAFWRYPVFNLADAFIVVGIFILIAFYGKIKRV